MIERDLSDVLDQTAKKLSYKKKSISPNFLTHSKLICHPRYAKLINFLSEWSTQSNTPQALTDIKKVGDWRRLPVLILLTNTNKLISLLRGIKNVKKGSLVLVHTSYPNNSLNRSIFYSSLNVQIITSCSQQSDRKVVLWASIGNQWFISASLFGSPRKLSEQCILPLCASYLTFCGREIFQLLQNWRCNYSTLITWIPTDLFNS